MVNEKLQKKKILIDTNFLISLEDEKDRFNDKAKKYLKFFLNNHNTLYLSAIVLFEFLLNHKDDQWQKNIKEFKKLDFTYLDSQKVLVFKNKRNYRVLSKQDKIQAKNDDKIIAQCINNNIDCLVTRDNKFINFVNEHVQNLPIGNPRYQSDLIYSLKCVNFETQDFNDELFLDKNFR